jgi:hypothetical protein
MVERKTPTQIRDEFFQMNKARLEKLAFNAIKRGESNTDFVLVAIDVDDNNWSALVESLMPGYDWNQIRDKGLKPVARGTVGVEVIDYIGKKIPSVVSVFNSSPPQDVYRCIVMASGGASIYNIKSEPHSELN